MDAEFVKKLRERRGITQQELADLTGVSFRTIQNYEAGGVIPFSKKKQLQELAREKDTFDSPNIARNELPKKREVSKVFAVDVEKTLFMLEERFKLLVEKDLQIKELIDLNTELTKELLRFEKKNDNVII